MKVVINRNIRKVSFGLIGFFLFLYTPVICVADSSPLEALSQTLPGGVTQYSVPIQTLLFFTILSFLPAILLMTTAFTRIVIVLSLLRMAMGTQTSPPNQVIVGMAMFLTFFVMQPTWQSIYDNAYVPYSSKQIGVDQAIEAATKPMRTFMMKQTRTRDLELFIDLARLDRATKAKLTPETLPLTMVVPAFVTSEMKTAFQIGFMIYIPFLVIDMVVASVMMSMGMMMLSPAVVSLPFKLMLFVLADGWNVLMRSLIASFVR